METLVVTVRDEAKRSQVEQLLQDMDGVERVERVRLPDEVTLLAQPSLAEEWDSPEDQRWDSLL
ncbi:hypothetical protein GGR92_004644 [Spirosoma lacussanchae]|uniref:hypothetical protein n=1 Tax=Spirosoma TaxID=107 RepID=UPI00098D3653|nr:MULTISPECIES: hypothetical protein [Spirosoma]